MMTTKNGRRRLIDSMLHDDACEPLIAWLLDPSIDWLIVCAVELLMMVDGFNGGVGNEVVMLDG